MMEVPALSHSHRETQGSIAWLVRRSVAISGQVSLIVVVDFLWGAAVPRGRHRRLRLCYRDYRHDKRGPGPGVGSPQYQGPRVPAFVARRATQGRAACTGWLRPPGGFFQAPEKQWGMARG